MLSSCLNENDSQVKKDINRYGRETVYRKFIENNYVYPTSFQDSVTVRLDTAREYLKSILPSQIGVESTERLLPLLEVQGVNGNLLGAFFNNLIYLSDNATFETTRHEAFHLVFQRLITPEQQRELRSQAQLKLAERLKKSNSTINQLLKDRRSRGLYYNLSDAEAKNLLYEEDLADQFASYNQVQPRNLLERVFTYLRNLTSWFTGDDQIKQLFQQIDNGYFVNHKVNEAINNPEINVPEFSLNAGNTQLSTGEKNELIRAISAQSLLTGNDVEQTLSDLHSEYQVSSEQIYEVGMMKGYEVDEIIEEMGNIEQEILSNKGYPVLAQIFQSPAETTMLKNVVEMYNSQFTSPIEQYIATATDQNPAITNQREQFNGQTLSYPSTTQLDSREVYRAINQISAQEGLSEDKFIDLYDLMQETPEKKRFFSQFLSDVFGENSGAVNELLAEGEFPSLSSLNPQQRAIFNGLTEMLYTGNEALNTQMQRILESEARNTNFREFLAEYGTILDQNNQEVFPVETIENSKQETCN